jgi:hypothetical protein
MLTEIRPSKIEGSKPKYPEPQKHTEVAENLGAFLASLSEGECPVDIMSKLRAITDALAYGKPVDTIDLADQPVGTMVIPMTHQSDGVLVATFLYSNPYTGEAQPIAQLGGFRAGDQPWIHVVDRAIYLKQLGVEGVLIDGLGPREAQAIPEMPFKPGVLQTRDTVADMLQQIGQLVIPLRSIRMGDSALAKKEDQILRRLRSVGGCQAGLYPHELLVYHSNMKKS